jgi:hypothetical protein
MVGLESTLEQAETAKKVKNRKSQKPKERDRRSSWRN